ncbi:MAG: hypothetical protein ACRDJ9_28660, partial [Dehalococcoidia bacterium]
MTTDTAGAAGAARPGAGLRGDAGAGAVKAIGRARVPVPDGQPRITDYVLEEVIWCPVCRRNRHPAPAADGTRFYACEPGCPKPPTEALPAEQGRTAGSVRPRHVRPV